MNTSHPAIKRLMNEFKDLQKNPSATIHAAPISDSNLFDWHFTIKGSIDSSYEGGRYHGRIIFTTEYPYKAPDVIMLTPNGRFETDKRICLNMTSFHGETWNAGCTIRILLRSLRMFFLEEEHGIGSIKYSEEERKKLAIESIQWKCHHCGCEMKSIEFSEGEDEDAAQVKSIVKSEDISNDNSQVNNELNENKIYSQVNHEIESQLKVKLSSNCEQEKFIDEPSHLEPQEIETSIQDIEHIISDDFKTKQNEHEIESMTELPNYNSIQNQLIENTTIINSKKEMKSKHIKSSKIEENNSFSTPLPQLQSQSQPDFTNIANVQLYNFEFDENRSSESQIESTQEIQNTQNLEPSLSLHSMNSTLIEEQISLSQDKPGFIMSLISMGIRILMIVIVTLMFLLFNKYISRYY